MKELHLIFINLIKGKIKHPHPLPLKFWIEKSEIITIYKASTVFKKLLKKPTKKKLSYTVQFSTRLKIRSFWIRLYFFYVCYLITPSAINQFGKFFFLSDLKSFIRKPVRWFPSKWLVLWELNWIRFFWETILHH